MCFYFQLEASSKRINLDPTIIITSLLIVYSLHILSLYMQGTRMKLVVNMIMGTMMGALAEGLTLSKSADISPEILLQVIFMLVFI